MRIFLLPPESNSSYEDLVLRACAVLRQSLILSARVGGIVNERPVVLVAPPDVSQAVAILKKAGIVAFTD
jgi:hypothetical protein